MRAVVLAGALVALSGCSPAEDAGGAGDGAPGGTAEAVATVQSADEQALRQELLEADREFARSVERSGIGGWMAAMDEDAQLVLPTGAVAGTEAIQNTMSRLFADSTFSLTWEPSFAAVSAGGDLGYTIGRFTRRQVIEGDEAVTRGSYLTVWERQPDGRWKVAADVGTELPPR